MTILGLLWNAGISEKSCSNITGISSFSQEKTQETGKNHSFQKIIRSKKALQAMKPLDPGAGTLTFSNRNSLGRVLY
jgi:hypothetical protein